MHSNSDTLLVYEVSDGSVLRSGDREALLDLADDLENYKITLKAPGKLTQINNEDRLVKIMQRCPSYVKSRWQTKVQEIRNDGCDPNVDNACQLIRRIAIEKNYPVFGGILDSEIQFQRPKGRNIRQCGQTKQRGKTSDWSIFAGKPPMINQ